MENEIDETDFKSVLEEVGRLGIVDCKVLKKLIKEKKYRFVR